jgi:hypothetical protein
LISPRAETACLKDPTAKTRLSERGGLRRPGLSVGNETKIRQPLKRRKRGEVGAIVRQSADRAWPIYQTPIKNRRRAARYRKRQKSNGSGIALRACAVAICRTIK